LANGAEGRNFKLQTPNFKEWTHAKDTKGGKGDAKRGKREPLIPANKTLIRRKKRKGNWILTQRCRGGNRIVEITESWERTDRGRMLKKEEGSS
jgi:hypothetical protein